MPDVCGEAAGEHVDHRFTLENGLIRAMQVCPVPPSV